MDIKVPQRGGKKSAARVQCINDLLFQATSSEALALFDALKTENPQADLTSPMPHYGDVTRNNTLDLAAWIERYFINERNQFMEKKVKEANTSFHADGSVSTEPLGRFTLAFRPKNQS